MLRAFPLLLWVALTAPGMANAADTVASSPRYSMICVFKKTPPNGEKISDQMLIINFDRPTSPKIDVSTIELVDKNRLLKGKPIVEFNLAHPAGVIGIFAKSDDEEVISIVGKFKKETGVFSSNLFTTSPDGSRAELDASMRGGGCKIAPVGDTPAILAEIDKRDGKSE